MVCIKSYFKYLFLTQLIFCPIVFSKSLCDIYIDAGSTGSRLFLFERNEYGPNVPAILHAGPEVRYMGISDPITETNGRTMGDLKKIISSIVSLPQDLLSGGSNFKAFNWMANCNVQKVKVWATAGMRLAEQISTENAKTLWTGLKSAMEEYFANKYKGNKKKKQNVVLPEIEVRTITGTEEGIFAWLNILRRRKGDYNFGILEMGGASMQITFPCQGCAKTIKVEYKSGNFIELYSYSFLGFGMNTAIQRYYDRQLCSAVQNINPSLVMTNCMQALKIEKNGMLIDPLNYGISNLQNNPVSIPLNEPMKKKLSWFLIGEFSKVSKKPQLCCNGTTRACSGMYSCFSSVFQKKILDTLGIKSGKRMSDSWLWGAYYCDRLNCIKSGKLTCDWLMDGICI